MYILFLLFTDHLKTSCFTPEDSNPFFTSYDLLFLSLILFLSVKNTSLTFNVYHTIKLFFLQHQVNIRTGKSFT